MISPKVRAVLDRYGLRALEFEPGSTPTSAKAAERLGVSVAEIAKSMLVKGRDERYYLIVCAGDARISNRKLKSLLGVKARMANPDETKSVTGFDPGGVCPFGVTGIDIFIDQTLDQHEVVYPAAGTDASGVPVTYDLLCRVSGGRPCDVTE